MRRKDESGSILVLSVVGVVLAVISTALAVDLGRLAQDKRTDQKVADLAALDASRDLTQACARAKASVVRNGMPASTLTCSDPASNPAGDVVRGNIAAGVFTVNAAGTAVRVKVHSAFKTVFPFVTGPNGLDVKGIAAKCSPAGFTIGSSLATIDTSRSTLLNSMIGRMIGGSSLSLSLVSWQGLASGSVTLDQLRTQLASMGFSVGSVSSLLSTDLTLAQFFQATANALTAKGDTANATLFNTLKVAATSTVKMHLGQFLTVAQDAEGVALGSRFNLFQLLTAAAEASAVNGNSFIDVANVGITVPGVASTAMHLKVIEPPMIWFGTDCKPEIKTTGQVQLTVTPTLNLNVTVGLSVLNVVNAMPINLTAAGATGVLKTVNCTSSPGITVTVDPKAFSGSATLATLRVKLLGLPLLDVPTTNVTPSIDGPAVDVSFSYPGEFSPTAASKHIGSQPVGLQSLTNVTAGSPTLLGVLPLGVTSGQIVTAVINALHTVIGDVDNSVLTPLLKDLGLDIGGADVTALADAYKPLQCGQPGLVG
ncbi:MAG TPA: hypothetical protein VM121_05220 [Acidimicrobiales bacterium]|nr:hypothetical protein [Acidimicrobiales bacterium]